MPSSPLTLPPGLVAVFLGGTSGIGEATLKSLAQHARAPHIYIVRRSQDVTNCIRAECKALSPDAEVDFVRMTDITLMREVDKVCKEIKRRAKVIDLLFLSAGSPGWDRDCTSHLNS